jgi:toxin ParE1/3/4
MRSLKLRFTGRARAHLERIYDYISVRSPGAARRVIARIRQTADGLGAFPLIGHKGLLPNTLEMNVKGLPYIIVYRVEGTEVIILAVFHGAQDREHSTD